MRGRGDFYRGAVAESYEHQREGSATWRKEDQFVDELLGISGAGPDSLLLDLPTGTGRFFDTYRNHGSTVLAVDISDEMLRIASSRASGESLAVADASRLPIRTATIGQAVCIRFAHLVTRSTLARALGEVRRSLRSDGALIIGVRLHGSHRGETGGRRLRNVWRRRIRAARFALKLENSRSVSERWFDRTLRRSGLAPGARRETATYDSNGSYYSIFLVRPTVASRRRRGESIELFGLPGVGKSTTARALLRREPLLAVDGYRAIENWSVLQCWLRSPGRVSGQLFRLWAVRDELGNEAARRIVVAALRQIVVKNRTIGRVLFEEGVTHEAWRQLYGGAALSDELLRRVLPAADTVLLLQAPKEILSERLGTKSGPGPISRQLRDDSSDEVWNRAFDAYRRLEGVLAGSGRRVEHLETVTSPEEGMSALTSALLFPDGDAAARETGR